MIKPPGAVATLRDVCEGPEFEGVEARIDILKAPGTGAAGSDFCQEFEFEAWEA